jgi:TonB family protein
LLGVTLVQAAAMQPPSWEPGAAAATLPENLPSVFRAPVSSCLRKDPGQRWTVEELEAYLRRTAAARPVFQPKPSSERSATPRYLFVAGAVALLLASAALLPRVLRHDAAPPQPVVQAPAPVVQDPAPIAAAPPVKTVRQEIVKQVLPDVPAKARETIRGKVTVRVRVRVDAAGSVAEVKNESPESSRFFGNLALQAARRWRFTPASPREWILRFEFVRNPKNPVSVQASASRS